MPGFLLHAGATVRCAHQGVAQAAAHEPKVTVSGQPIVTQVGAYTVAGCALPPPPSGNGPCVSALFTSAATKITSFGRPVLLFDSQATCAPTATPLLILSTQTRASGT